MKDFSLFVEDGSIQDGLFGFFKHVGFVTKSFMLYMLQKLSKYGFYLLQRRSLKLSNLL